MLRFKIVLLAQNTGKWRAVLCTAMSLQFLSEAGNTLDSRATVFFQEGLFSLEFVIVPPTCNFETELIESAQLLDNIYP
jgi:hypothetical protein